MPGPVVSFTANYRWRNKHQNVNVTAARLYSVWNLWKGAPAGGQDWRAGLAGLQEVILDAERLGRRVRPIGGAWSLSDFASSSDFLVDTKALNALKIGFAAEDLVPAARPRAGELVLAQCGTSVLELNRALESRGLSLRTSGASTGQTIAGAVATGTHGAANQVGAMQECVVAFHLLGEGGESIWVEAASTPIATDPYLSRIGITRVVRDDAMFRAAKVGVGGFGVVHSVVLEVEPIYLLECTVRRLDVDAVREAIRTLDVISLGLPDGATLPFHFEVVLNPYATGAGEKGAYVRFMYKRPFRALPAPPHNGGVVSAPGDDLLGVIGSVGDVVPELLPTVLTHVLDQEIKSVEGSLGTHGQTFGPTTIRGAGMSMELGIRVEQVSDVVDVIVQVARQHVFGGLIALRYVRSTDACLGFTRMPERTCTLELPSTLSTRTQEAFEMIVEHLSAAAIPFTLHWGQCLPTGYGPGHVQQRYGADATAYVDARRRLLPSSAGRRTFASPTLERFQLAD